jgi:hypothetical protein
MANNDACLSAVRNMLMACAGATAGERLLILREDPVHGYYGPGLDTAIATAAERLGLTVTIHDVPLYAQVDALPAELEPLFQTADHALFLTRLGDQLRFLRLPHGAHAIVSSVLDVEMLASPFATAPYQPFFALKEAVDDLFLNATAVRMSCERGTDLTGRVPAGTTRRNMDVRVKRFPMSIFAPMDAAGFSGRVAVDHFLVGTGSRYYEPYGVPLTDTVFAELSEGRVASWRGSSATTARVQAHYAFVAERYGIDPDIVHSWHAGIHPACAYHKPAATHFERWSGAAFGNPRLLHFHTCGAYAPGEICWHVVDPTIEVDGKTVWRAGRIDLDAVPGALDIIKSYPEVIRLFETPTPFMGI